MKNPPSAETVGLVLFIVVVLGIGVVAPLAAWIQCLTS